MHTGCDVFNLIKQYFSKSNLLKGRYEGHNKVADQNQKSNSSNSIMHKIYAFLNCLNFFNKKLNNLHNSTYLHVLEKCGLRKKFFHVLEKIFKDILRIVIF